jgi:hypothetical protein
VIHGYQKCKECFCAGWQWQIKPVRLEFQFYPTDIAASPNGGCYILFPVTLAELNDTGLVIMQTANVKGTRLFVLPGGDFIVMDSALKRLNLAGTVAGAFPAPRIFSPLTGLYFRYRRNNHV